MNSHIHIKCLTLSILNSCHSFCKRWNYGPWQFDFVILWNYVLKIGSSQTFLFCEKVIWRRLQPWHFCWPRISLKLSENSFWDKKPPIMTHWTPPLLSLFGIRPPSNWISEYEMKPFRSQTINMLPFIWLMQIKSTFEVHKEQVFNVHLKWQEEPGGEGCPKEREIT